MKKCLMLLVFMGMMILSLNCVSAQDTGDNLSVEISNSTIPFVENEGQTNSEVEYYVDTFYGTVYVTHDSIIHSVKEKTTPPW
ncbi:hypothetical protein [Methanobacterium petrolearium]|uniref:hypothetical protein n=1 Tax=Methanobacterium petrolearium TaxID=710190 RepID=UPI003081C24E|nr:hypothetical protein GCM10025861_18920 [Methanobacterium petrolearium]